jgi:hypothetical protein
LKKYISDTETQDIKLKGIFSAKKDEAIDIGSVYLLRSYLLEGKR